MFLRLCCMLCLSCQLWAGDAPPTDKDPAALATAGMTLLREADAEPTKLVDAALVFHEAMVAYEVVGDSEGVCAMQANLFWCKKKMNLPTLESYLKAKGADRTRIEAALKQVDATVAKPVEVSAAPDYLARAEAFASKHADEPLAIAIRYFEVANRFPDHEAGRTAQAKSLEAMTSYSKAPAPWADTIFSKSTVAPGERSPVPDAAAQKAALAAVKASFKDEYSNTKERGVLAAKLLGTARDTNDDPAGRWALLSEAGAIAAGTESWHIVVLAGDMLAAHYDGVDATAIKEGWCAKSNVRGAEAVRTLLKDPTDAAANTNLGILFVLRGRDLERGLPMLARGADLNLARLAKQELAGPTGPAQQTELADMWFELAKKRTEKPEKEFAFGQARTWYERVVGQPGLSQKKAKDRIIEINDLVPPPPSDFSNLTAKQWESLPGRVVQMANSTTAKDTGLTLRDGEKVRLCPHPTEQWKVFTGGVEMAYTWRGGKAPNNVSGYYEEPDFGCLRLALNGQRVEPGQIVTGPGKVQASMECYWVGRRNSISARGAIRVKAVPAE